MENDKKLPVYKLVINECNGDVCDSTETNFISMVETPAIDIDYIAFSKDSVKKAHTFKVQDTGKRMLVGPLMVADLPIYRRNPNTGEEYYVVFDSEAIENAVKNFSKKGYNSNINIEHDVQVENAYLMESWIVTDPKKDKSAAFGFKNITKGSWMGIVYCPNDEVWNTYIKSGQLKGFSVEGIYGQSDQPVAYFSKETPELTKDEQEIIDYLSRILGEE